MKWPTFDHILSHSVRGKVFRLIWRKPPNTAPNPRTQHTVGRCDHPSTPNKEIWIWPRQPAMDLVETTIHECGHAAFPDLDEESIDTFASSTTRLLCRMGMEVTFKPK